MRSLFALMALTATLIPIQSYAIWMSVPYCYKHLGPGNMGVTLVAPTCNSGLMCGPHGCAPIADCGPMGALCNVPLGCLNGVCAGGLNAIWDPITHKCGCDVGGAAGAAAGAAGGGTLSQEAVGAAGGAGGGVASGGTQDITGGTGVSGAPTATSLGKTKFDMKNDEKGFESGQIRRKDGTMVTVNPKVQQATKEVEGVADKLKLGSVVGGHSKLTASGLVSQHWTGDAADYNNDKKTAEYLFNNRERLGVRQMITGKYPQFNIMDGKPYSKYKPYLIKGHMDHIHAGFYK